ncbi:MAG: hypothetical protein WC023_01560 [Rhodocyclaceae bacterium]
MSNHPNTPGQLRNMVVVHSSFAEQFAAVEQQRDELLEAAMNLENDDGAIPAHAWDLLQSAIANVRKATGKCYYAPDGTLMNADGTRSIFDDVDQ